MAQGVCTQRHFPAVAQPFRVLWAPWPLALLGSISAIVIALFAMTVISMTLGGILLPVLLVSFHILAIVFGLKLRYLASMVLALENRRTGTTNLTVDPGTFNFSNI